MNLKRKSFVKAESQENKTESVPLEKIMDIRKHLNNFYENKDKNKAFKEYMTTNDNTYLNPISKDNRQDKNKKKK